MKPIKKEIFRAYDIRGIVDVDFDPEWVETFGKACGTYFRKQGIRRVAVGHDCRHSSPIYQQSIIKGLTQTGVDVIFLNMVATPLFYFAVKFLNLQGGVMITASHNPKDFNGFKIWAHESTIHTDEILKIYEIMKSGDFLISEKLQGLATEMDIVPAYINHLTSDGKLPHPIKVVVDGGNGAAGEVCAEVLRKLGAEVIELYCEPDGDFPNHHPDPTVLENIADLKQKVIEENAHLGIGLDGDGDRIGVLDETGNIIYGDKLLAIFARDILKKHPGATIIGEVKCSYLLYDDIKKHGGKPIMWKTGHSLIKAKMKEEGALLAGEMSGHMFFADKYFGFDDAIYAAKRLVEIIAQNPQKPLSTYLNDWPQTVTTPEIRMQCPDKIKFEVIKKAQKYFKEKYTIIDVDGVRIVFPDGWGLLRASNTQPVLVLRFEATNQERLEEIRKIIETPLKQWIKELS
ncbi:phosphomannomutase / phosphoglucomutase [Desulfonauticus submarinus]|uniref:Phosphomannomutase / phosphoglucomutase n=1 Tax=Desulfonauticus submarinus TaxID=206665 RepID=A0A1H0CPM4_9BACT|nr:phosphomannomutase/phosphoglucomutase [Desulfonauticus submarinus]SDN59852.1 phosphomannomutase / phosphoglucomutase [Desulfonauticus submarinus]